MNADGDITPQHYAFWSARRILRKYSNALAIEVCAIGRTLRKRRKVTSIVTAGAEASISRIQTVTSWRSSLVRTEAAAGNHSRVLAKVAMALPRKLFLSACMPPLLDSRCLLPRRACVATADSPSLLVAGFPFGDDALAQSRIQQRASSGPAVVRHMRRVSRPWDHAGHGRMGEDKLQ
jgi:hypothetical protein